PTVLGGAIGSPLDLAASSAASGFIQTLATTDSTIHLRYLQLNFFGQDEWHLRPNLSLSYGLRYEYNTSPHELQQRIEAAFSDPRLSLAPGLAHFIDGRTKIFDSSRRNFAPRIGLAYAHNFFGAARPTLIRAGYGIYYDQILGAVVSQSRNVFPNFVTINTAGGILAHTTLDAFDFFNPASPLPNDLNPLGNLVAAGTLNRLNPGLTLEALTDFINSAFKDSYGATLPARRLKTPTAHQYSITLEQQLGSN